MKPVSEILGNLKAIATHINDRHNNSNLPPIACGWCEEATEYILWCQFYHKQLEEACREILKLNAPSLGGRTVSVPLHDLSREEVIRIISEVCKSYTQSGFMDNAPDLEELFKNELADAILAHSASPKVSPEQSALKKIADILAQPIDRISEITLEDYAKIRQSILDICSATGSIPKEGK
jgi:hypothetical protein